MTWDNATLVERLDLNEELAVLRVSPDSEEVPEFAPGQYAELGFPDPKRNEPGAETIKVLRRSYSIASAPAERRFLEFYVVRVPDGEVTPRLFDLQTGGRLWLGPKIKGKFTLEDVTVQERDLIMISTGTGLAPFLSMVRHHKANPPWRRCVIIHGTRYERDLGYREELMELQATVPELYYIPILSREPESSTWMGERGRVQTILGEAEYRRLVGHDLNPEEAQVLLCGNPEMIDAVTSLLETKGFRLHKKKNPGNLHFERYW